MFSSSDAVVFSLKSSVWKSPPQYGFARTATTTCSTNEALRTDPGISKLETKRNKNADAKLCTARMQRAQWLNDFQEHAAHFGGIAGLAPECVFGLCMEALQTEGIMTYYFPPVHLQRWGWTTLMWLESIGWEMSGCHSCSRNPQDHPALPNNMAKRKIPNSPSLSPSWFCS